MVDEWIRDISMGWDILVGTRSNEMSKTAEFWEMIGTHDLRLSSGSSGGFVHVILRDADDGDVIVINEDDLRALRDRLDQIIKENNL